MLSQSLLRSLLDYDPVTGIFSWKKSMSSRVRAGQRAGRIHGKYRYIKINGTEYAEHSLAWLYCYGHFDVRLDHENRSGHDNRIQNLRKASNSEQQANRSAQNNNKSGYKGVFVDSRRPGRYRAKVTFEGKNYYYGSFATPEAAYAVYCAKAKELHGHFFCGEPPTSSGPEVS